MNWRDPLGFLVLIVGVVGVIGGIGAIVRDAPIGWAALVLGFAASYFSFVLMRPQPQ